MYIYVSTDFSVGIFETDLTGWIDEKGGALVLLLWKWVHRLYSSVKLFLFET